MPLISLKILWIKCHRSAIDKNFPSAELCIISPVPQRIIFRTDVHLFYWIYYISLTWNRLWSIKPPSPTNYIDEHSEAWKYKIPISQKPNILHTLIFPSYMCQWTRALLVQTTVWCHYNAVNFLQNPHKKHPTACQLGQGMGYFLWFHVLIHILPW